MKSSNDSPSKPLASVSRRHLLKGAAAGFLAGAPPAWAWPQLAADETPIPFIEPFPDPGKKMVRWDDLTSWQTPIEDFFTVQHYGIPEDDPEKWTLRVEGLVRTPTEFTLEQLQAFTARKSMATFECAGNGAFPKFKGAVGNAQWTGAMLSLLLRQVGIDRRAKEIVFYGADKQVETIREKEYPQHFARSLSYDEAMSPDTMLIMAMNDKPLPKEHGGPLRLGVMGHYGVAWVKWLNRIEAIDRRFSGKFMARDYVTIRGEPQESGEVTWRETTVTRMRLKSIVARAVRRPGGFVRFYGAAWNDGHTPIKTVEVQVDGGPWQGTHLSEGVGAKSTWIFWNFDWKNPPAGEHTIVSRVSDLGGGLQPPASDPSIEMKRTYWEANEQVPRRIRL